MPTDSILSETPVAHSPVPWTVAPRLTASENHKGYRIAGGGDGFYIADVYPMDEDGAEGGANASLIAAAPELLAALEFCHSVIREGGLWDMSERMAVDKANAAIAKAKGGAA